jgi:hypothetical protein
MDQISLLNNLISYANDIETLGAKVLRLMAWNTKAT